VITNHSTMNEFKLPEFHIIFRYTDMALNMGKQGNMDDT